MVERIKWVDIARGIGILMVVYWHSLKGVYNYIGFNKAVYDIQIDFFDSFCMAAFFMISGFFVRRWLERTPKVAIMQKIQLLFIPYLIWSFIQVVPCQ